MAAISATGLLQEGYQQPVKDLPVVKYKQGHTWYIWHNWNALQTRHPRYNRHTLHTRNIRLTGIYRHTRHTLYTWYTWPTWQVAEYGFLIVHVVPPDTGVCV